MREIRFFHHLLNCSLTRCFLEVTLLANNATGNRTELVEREAKFFEIEDFEYTIKAKTFVDLTIDQVLEF